MRNNTKLNRIVFLAVAAALASLGPTCADTGLLPTDSVAVVFVNFTGYEVDPTVNGERMDTVMPDISTRPILFDCTPGDTFQFSGSVRTNTQTLPSPYWFNFIDRANFICGQTIEITYFLNAQHDLDLDGVSY